MNEEERRKNDELIRSVLRNTIEHDHRAKRLLEIRDFEKADRSDVDVISRILLDEFTATGIDNSSEPTRRGLDVEAAIDWLRRAAAGRPK